MAWAGINIGRIINSISDSDVDGATFAGGLVGVNAGNINNGYATGTVRGNLYYAGGLVGLNVGITANTYAVGDVTGNERVGGLVGDNRNLIAASYAAIGEVIGTRLVGALVGINSGSIMDSYVGRDDPNNFDLVGGNLPVGTTENSVILIDTTFQSEASIAGWSAANWDFGNDMSYPTLRYDNSLCDSSDTPRCGLLPNQQYETGLGALFLISGGEVLNPDLRLGDQPFSVSQENYSVSIVNQSEVQLRPFAINGDDAEIRVITAGNDQDYFSGKSSGELSTPIPLDMDSTTTVYVVVTDGDVETRYTLVMTGLGIATESGTVVNEGDQITLNASMIGDSYTWSSIPANSVDILSGQGTANLRVRIPETFVPGGAETTRATLVFEVNIVAGETTYTLSREFIVNKINNGMPPDIALDLGDSPTTLSIVVSGGTDSDGEGVFNYIWERVYVNENGTKVSDTVSGSSEYRVPDATGSNRYRVNVTHTDGQGYVTEYADREAFILQLMRLGMDDDVDDDGLIDVYYLEDLDAIREHLSEMPATCGQDNNGACQGYELQRSLDFDDADSYEAEVNQAWRSGEGWQPIGIIETSFNAILTASTNTLSISNLYINRPEEDNIGLFGVIGPQAQILDVHLRDATVIGRYAVGGLAGFTSRLTDNEGSVSESSLIANSSVIDSADRGFSITATHAWVGGLVGSNFGSIVNSYARVGVQGRFAVGGLAGYSFGPISDSYALSSRGSAPSVDINGREAIAVGGLVGYNHNERPFKGGGSITNSYANIRVEGDFDVGGLVGYNDAGTITNSYALGNVIGSTNVGGLVGFSSTGTIVGYAGNNVTGANNVGNLISPESSGTVTELPSQPTLTYSSDLDNNGYSSCAVGDGETDYRVRLPACGTPLPSQNVASRMGGSGSEQCDFIGWHIGASV